MSGRSNVRTIRLHARGPRIAQADQPRGAPRRAPPTHLGRGPDPWRRGLTSGWVTSARPSTRPGRASHRLRADGAERVTSRRSSRHSGSGGRGGTFGNGSLCADSLCPLREEVTSRSRRERPYRADMTFTPIGWKPTPSVGHVELRRVGHLRADASVRTERDAGGLPRRQPHRPAWRRYHPRWSGPERPKRGRASTQRAAGRGYQSNSEP